jgi:hypothetical protein
MRRHRLCRLHLLLIMPLTLLVVSARLTWTQARPSANETPTQLSNLAAQFVAIPESKISFQPAYENLSLPFAPTQGQSPSQVRFRALDIGYHLSLIKNNALPELSQLAKIDEPQVRANHFIGNAPAEWLTDVNPRNTVHYRALDLGGDLEYYGQHIPWAGRIILSIGEKAKVHPRVFRVFELIGPGLTFENRVPRESVGNIHVSGRGQLTRQGLRP